MATFWGRKCERSFDEPPKAAADASCIERAREPTPDLASVGAALGGKGTASAPEELEAALPSEAADGVGVDILAF
jgi:hypothetical protein